MPSHVIFPPKPVGELKRTLTDSECDSGPASKRTRLSPDQLPTPPNSIKGDHLSQFNFLRDCPDWRQRLKSSLLKPLDTQHPPTTKPHTTNPCVDAWLNAVPYPRSFSPPSYASRPGQVERKGPKSCEARFDLGRSDPQPGGAKLTFATLQKMSRQDSQSIGNVVPRSKSSGNQTHGPSDPRYRDTLYAHGIVVDLSGQKVPQELVSLKERILQRRSSPPLDDQAVLAVMNEAEELAYATEGPASLLLRTPMLPIGYGGLLEGGNTQWNTIALPNNPRCNKKLSAPKPDSYLAFRRGPKSPWTVEQNNVVDHPRVQPYSQPTKRHTFPSLSIELKAESTGGVLITAEAQAAGSGSHSVSSMLWLLEEAKTAGLTGVDLMKDTVSFSIVASHRQAVIYLHWLDPKERHFHMSYLRSYSTFEAEDIRRCNNTIKNIIDNAQGPRRIKIGEALLTLQPLISSWDPQSTAIDPPTSGAFFSGDPRSSKRGRSSQV